MTKEITITEADLDENGLGSTNNCIMANALARNFGTKVHGIGTMTARLRGLTCVSWDEAVTNDIIEHFDQKRFALVRRLLPLTVTISYKQT